MKVQMLNLNIHKIQKDDLEALSDFFLVIMQSKINEFFHPHNFDSDTAGQISRYSGEDMYSGVFIQKTQINEMIGYVILRGWDEGFAYPSLGLCILPSYQCIGIGELALKYALVIARLRHSPGIRLKVYPHNKPAVQFYTKNGFIFNPELENSQFVGYLHFNHPDYNP